MGRAEFQWNLWYNAGLAFCDLLGPSWRLDEDDSGPPTAYELLSPTYFRYRHAGVFSFVPARPSFVISGYRD